MIHAAMVASAVSSGCVVVANAQQPSCSATSGGGGPQVIPQARTAPTSLAEIPASIRAEHEELWAELNHATVCPGRVGVAARLVAERLRPHFAREEQIALPPLGLLRPLARDSFAREMSAAVSMADSLAAELPRMLREHREIRWAVDRMAEYARSDMRPEQLRLAERLRLHAQMEEEVLYPTAILIGKYVAWWLAIESHAATARP
jgi:hypothetical protein